MTTPLNDVTDERVNTLINIDDIWQSMEETKASFARVVESVNEYYFALREINDVITAMLSIPNTSVVIHAREIKDILDKAL